MNSIKYQLALLYVTVSEFLEKHPSLAGWRQSNHKRPEFSDAEVLTIALMQGYFRTPTLKRTFLLVLANDGRAFPKCCGYAQWLARLNRLSRQLEILARDVAQAHATDLPYYFVDSQPIPLCHRLRHGRVRTLREDGAWFGKTSKGWFFGFKLHILIDSEGLIVNAVLTPGNWDDREGVIPLTQAIHAGSVTVGDLGYRSQPLQTDVWQQDGIVLVTRADADPHQQRLMCTVRERVETVFSQLTERFALRVYARSWLGLWNSLLLKILDHSLTKAGIIPA